MSEVLIGTCNDTITCNEVLACALLKLLPRYRDGIIIRTHFPEVLDSCDIVIGAGEVYDPSRHRYDYHMEEFYETASTVLQKPNYNRKIKLSSAGLIYCHFGHEILRLLFPHIEDEGTIEEIFKEIYDTFIVQIDASGNDQIMPAYHLPYYEPAVCMCDDLHKIVHNITCNTWKQTHMLDDDLFEKAVVMILPIFKDFVICAEKVWLPAKRVVQNAINNRFKVHPSGLIIELLEPVTWQQHLYRLEREMRLDIKINFIIFKSECGSSYMLHCVPIVGKAAYFARRIDFPYNWRGLNNGALVEVCGIQGAEFVHKSGIIARHKNRDGIINMAMATFEIETLMPRIRDTEPTYDEYENMIGNIWCSDHVPPYI